MREQASGGCKSRARQCVPMQAALARKVAAGMVVPASALALPAPAAATAGLLQLKQHPSGGNSNPSSEPSGTHVCPGAPPPARGPSAPGTAAQHPW